jgi:uncharacterized protein (TIGR02246 family)
MNTKARLLMVGGIISLLTIGGISVVQLSGRAAESETTKDKADDTAAIKNAGQAFLKAYLAGDAKALAAHWTENGEYFTDDGTTIRGRAAIEKTFTEVFAKRKPATHAALEVTSIRFPSKDTAIEEGYFKVSTGKDAPTSSRYTLLRVRDDGHWLMAVARDWPGEGATLHDLEWLIGSWEAKRGDLEIHTSYQWWGDKGFIRVAITLKEKGRTRDGFQMIGKDRSTGQIRSWTFDSEGSFAEATWSRDGNKWMMDSAGILDDGGVLAVTNILTRLDNDSFTFQSVQRKLNGEEIEDIPAVRVIRVKDE